MNRKWIKTGVTVFASACLSQFRLAADPATPGPSPSEVQTQLRLEIDKNTDMVHFIQTNNDPDIITKTYVLKHADPYELRPYLRDALEAERVTSGTSKVEAVKYNDGTGVLLVSAEDYKFDRAAQNGGMIIDDIVEVLDQPQITSSSGQGKLLYFPRYRTAADLLALLREVGMSVAANTQENLRGKDVGWADGELNAIWFYISNWSIKYMKQMLEVYDRPLPEVRVAYKIFEIDKENDAKIGADWQAWKNGPGSDFFTAASRYSRGWDFTNSIPGLPWVKDSHTEFLKFSPRWNSRFLDIVAAQGDATILTEGQINLINAQTGAIEALTEFPSFVPSDANANLTLLGYARYTNIAAINDRNQLRLDLNLDGTYTVTISATDMDGNLIELGGAAARRAGLNLMISRVNDGSRTYYEMRLDEENAEALGVQWVARGYGNVGYTVRCTGDFTGITWITDEQLIVRKDADRATQINTLRTLTDTFGYRLNLRPSVTSQATTMEINIYNTSLIGFRNNGTPRTERSEFNTKVMVSNDGSRFVIGGIEKKTSINSAGKLPWLGSLPGLGWLLGSESDVGKNTRIVTVLECVPSLPEAGMPSAIMGDIGIIGDDTEDVGSKINKIGFDQFHFDKDKRSFDPLP